MARRGTFSKSKLGLVVGAVGSSFLVLTIVAIIIFWYCRLWRPKHDHFVDVPGEDDMKTSFGQVRRFSWREMQIATDNFNENNAIGLGGFGKVYRRENFGLPLHGKPQCCLLRELKPREKSLDWPKRKRVAFGAAHGLEYLHEHWSPKITHRDMKAANILPDEIFEAVLGAFGLAKVVDTKLTHVTTQIRGTMGHIAPEYLSTGKSSEKTDVLV